MSRDTKKSDEQNSSVTKTRLSSHRLGFLKRRTDNRKPEKRILIVCEDEKSAPNYFNALKSYYRLTALIVEHSKGKSQPPQVVQKAIKLKDDAKNDPDSLYSAVWCVIDGEYGSDINNARSEANANGIRLAISTMCFEYWILLHFEEKANRSTNCKQIVSHLKQKHIPNYAKGSCDFRKVVLHVYKACERAERLRKLGIRHYNNPEDQNPCSEVYLLIKAILPPAPGVSD